MYVCMYVCVTPCVLCAEGEHLHGNQSWALVLRCRVDPYATVLIPWHLSAVRAVFVMVNDMSAESWGIPSFA
jgi:hypothetical protein